MPATTKLYIGNLPEDADRSELDNLFKKFGRVVEFDILKDYGFVHFQTEDEAKAACAALDGQVHRGNNIKVEISRSKVRQKAGMGGRGECYRCGGEGHWSKECPRGPSRDRGRGRGGGGDRGGRFRPYDRRDPYYPEPYDYYPPARRYPPPPSPYERYRYDPYERRLPPLPPRDPYRDVYDRPGPEYYRRSPPSRDLYYDYYERRGGLPSSVGAASAVDEVKHPRPSLSGRVPGPY